MPRLATSRLGHRFSYRPPPGALPQAVAAPAALAASEAVDLRAELSPVRDQGSEGSCYAFAAATFAEYSHRTRDWLSPEYLAWRTRLAIGTFPEDSGASIIDVMGVLHAWGAPPEAFLPYTPDPAGRPPPAFLPTCDVAAHPFRVGAPCRVDLEQLRQVLAVGPVVLGFACYQNFERVGADGALPPRHPEDGLLGGHAVLAVGADERGIILRNSWGTRWGDGGYCYAPEADFLPTVFEAWFAARQ